MSPTHNNVKSLSNRIFRSVLTFTLIVLFVFGTVMSAIFYTTYERDAEEDLSSAAQNVATSLGDLDSQACEQALSQQFSDAFRYTLIDTDGAVLYDSVADASTIYEVPLMLHAQHLDEIVCKKLGLETKPADLSAWADIVHKLKNPIHNVTIGMVGKYVDYADSYKSLNEALTHAGIHTSTKVSIRFIDSTKIEENGTDCLKGLDGILVPGGFGKRGTEGMIQAIEYARVNKIPFLGICLGMQCAVIEFARHVCGLGGANSTELDPGTPHPVVALLTEWKDHSGAVQRRDESSDLGGTMRLGRQEVPVAPNTLAHKIYGDVVAERHRHRYEVNNSYVPQFEEKGMVISAKTPLEHLPEMMELHNHPFFFAVQFHPEFTSNPRFGHPLFKAYIEAAVKHREAAEEAEKAEA